MLGTALFWASESLQGFGQFTMKFNVSVLLFKEYWERMLILIIEIKKKWDAHLSLIQVSP